jgi:branched-chain amino acid transport system substrate-binding protein
MNLGRLVGWFQGRFRSKWKMFGVIVAGVAVIATVISLLAYSTILDDQSRRVFKIAVIAPLSGSDQRIGESIRDGVALFATQANKGKGLGGRRLEVMAFDDGNDPVKAAQAAEAAARDPDVIAVIGHYSGAAADAAAKVYEQRRLPAISLAAAISPPESPRPWIFRLTSDENFEIKFLANYIRNVVGEKLVTVIYAASPDTEALANTFDEVLQRFGTKVLFKVPLDLAPEHADASLKAVTDDFKDKKLIGTIVVLGDSDQSARAVAALRESGLKNPVVGMRTLATDSFKQHFAEEWKGPGSIGAAMGGMLMTAPMLFDTAGAEAQDFHNAFVRADRRGPDWLAAMAFDSAKLIAASVPAPAGSQTPPILEMRSSLRDQLAFHDSLAHAALGLNGPIYFDRNGSAVFPTMIGVYDGSDLIAAMTQLSPIREEGGANYLQELVAGRALYVNDRFMYKTNVIYSGVRVEKVSSIDTDSNTAQIEMIVWFRWRGDFEPEDIVFTNAVTPIALDKPERQGVIDDINYKAYRVNGKFFMNFLNSPHPYGTKLIGMTFHHRTLSRNNVMYVSDILGMGLAGDKTLGQKLSDSNLALSSVGQKSGLLDSVKGALNGIGVTSLDPFAEALMRSQVLAGLSGWVVDHASVSQEVESTGTDGDPTYVGFGRPRPDFSTLNLGILVKPDSFDLTAYLSRSVMVYMAIFAFAGAVLASVLDRKERGQFWRMQTLLLRIITWPLLLMSLGTLVLDYASQNWAASSTDTILLIYRLLWWVVPAQLAVYSVERFVWVPLENHTGRKVPNIVRHMTLVVIYLLAIFGIIAFVMGKTITSLLATSGLMAMIIGLAVQSNLKDVFSGIVLNIERPFNIGDDIRIGSMMGRVVDITWRTTRLQQSDKSLISFPNGKVSEAEIHNYSRSGISIGEATIFLDARYEPSRILSLIQQCLVDDQGQSIMPGTHGVTAVFTGVEWLQGSWAARYLIKLELANKNDVKRIMNGLWLRLWPKLRDAGVSWERFEHLQVQEKSSDNVRALTQQDWGKPAA